MLTNILKCLSFITTAVLADLAVDMGRKDNFTIESHYVTTDDGYILHLHRIPPQGNISIGNKYTTTVMLLIHGLLESSPVYLVRPNKESAGSFYADRGFDVWLGNDRGNRFSRNHTTLNPDELPFWEFSFHEIGIYDLPAVIDYILAVTNQTQLIYMGHSQAATTLFILLSERPEYNEKIAIAHAMTPPIVFKNNGPLLHSIAQHTREIEAWVVSNGYYEFFPFDFFSNTTKPLAELCVCPIINDFCKTFFEIAMGTSSPYSWHSRILIEVATVIPSGASYRQFSHYGQLIANASVFHKYDHGRDKNLQVYGTPYPPAYNLSNINTKIHILYGTNDLIVQKENIPSVLEKIKDNVVAITKMSLLNHADFQYGRQVLSVQEITFKVLKKYLKKP